jgi:hypothetical protein
VLKGKGGQLALQGCLYGALNPVVDVGQSADVPARDREQSHRVGVQLVPQGSSPSTATLGKRRMEEQKGRKRGGTDEEWW